MSDPPVDSGERATAERFARLAARLAELEAKLATPEQEALRAQVARIDNSIIWQGVQGVRRAVYRRTGEDSRVARAISAMLRHAAAVAGMNGTRDASVDPLAPIAYVPEFAEPELSLILPVHSQPALTTACVKAIVAAATVPYELIVVDDTAVPSVKEAVSRIEGASVLMNDENLGYTRSLNRGASVARGRFLVFVNDDTLPHPGSLEAMLACAEASSDVGVVVPMYLDPSGHLKEAGAIIWNDGSAAQFGWGDPDPDRSRYGYRREVDYGSGACLMIRADLFRQVGGLDESFSPAYYEDVDLCFAAREAGARVVYEPRARVVHVEGATAGSDVTAGAKRFQVVNHGVFAEKWRHRLEEQPRRGSDVRLASLRGRSPHVLIADDQVPKRDRDGGSRRMWKLIEAFCGLGCMVTFLPASGEAAEPYATELRDRGVEVLRPMDAPTEIAAIGSRLGLAVLSRPHVATRYLHLLRELAPSAAVAYDTVDLHYLRELRRSTLEGVPAGRRIDAIREVELAMVRASDVTIAVTDDDREEIRAQVPGADVVVIPTIEQPRTRVPGTPGRAGIVFVGSFSHLPNVDAALFLVESVMPHVWQELPDVRVKIVGEHPPPDVQGLASPRVEVAGWVDDLTAVFDTARAAVAPLRYGAGLKMKNVEAMAHGVPTVTTTLGTEGITAGDVPCLLVADEPHDIAEHIVALHRDDDLWQRTSDAALAFVRARYAPEVVAPLLRALLPSAGVP